MSETAYKWATVAIALSKPVGNAMAGALAGDVADGTMFDRASPVRPIGSTGPATGWLVIVPCIEAVHLAVSEYNSQGPEYPLLNARGVSDQAVAAAKPHLFATSGPRGEELAPAFMATLGYEYVP